MPHPQESERFLLGFITCWLELGFHRNLGVPCAGGIAGELHEDDLGARRLQGLGRPGDYPPGHLWYRVQT